MRIGVLTSGGDAPGMNAALRSVVKVGLGNGHEVLGILRGYAGLLEGEAQAMHQKDVDGISRFGGTILGSARSKIFPTSDGQTQAKAQIAKLGLDALVVIGGNGSLTGAHILGNENTCQIVGLPASIDNDVGHCGMAIGVDTAVNTIVEACDRISDTARAHHRAFIVEVMGRACGYLAMRSGIAAEADAILFAERQASADDVIERLVSLMRNAFSSERTKKRFLIIKAEGVAVPTPLLMERLRAEMESFAPDVDIRETILGHVVRGGSPSATDRVIAQRLGLAAVLALQEGAHDQMLSWEPPGGVGKHTEDPSVNWVPFPAMIEESARLVDGTSAVTAKRIAMLEGVEGILAL